MLLNENENESTTRSLSRPLQSVCAQSAGRSVGAKTAVPPGDEEHIGVAPGIGPGPHIVRNLAILIAKTTAVPFALLRQRAALDARRMPLDDTPALDPGANCRCNYDGLRPET